MDMFEPEYTDMGLCYTFNGDPNNTLASSVKGAIYLYIYEAYIYPITNTLQPMAIKWQNLRILPRT
jgi:hypothetical protein